VAGVDTGRRRNTSGGLPDRRNLSGGPSGFYNLAVDGTGEDLALTGQTGRGGPGPANRGGSGSARQSLPGVPCETSGCGAGPRLLLASQRSDYFQNCHQGCPGAAFKAVWANSRCSSPICRSLAASCVLSISTSSPESSLGTSWALLGTSSEIRSTQRPRVLRPLIDPSANLRRMVFLLTPSAWAAPATEYSMRSRVPRVGAHCLLKNHKALTRDAGVWGGGLWSPS